MGKGGIEGSDPRMKRITNPDTEMPADQRSADAQGCHEAVRTARDSVEDFTRFGRIREIDIAALAKLGALELQ